jgi:hypothetical protein
MKISFHCKREKDENINIESFAKFYLPSYFSEIKKEILISCPDEDTTQKRPDYYLSPPGIAVEVKRLYDKEDIEKREKRNRIQSALNELTSKEQTLNAVYFLQYPWDLNIKRRKEKNVAKKIFEAVKSNLRSFKIDNVGSFKVIDKLKYDKTKIILAIPNNITNITETIYKSVLPLIGKVEQQLSNVDATKKIFLLIADYFLSRDIPDLFKALSYSYNSLSQCKNIDEIWLQIKTPGDEFQHHLLYSSDFFTSFERGAFERITEKEIYLFENWFRPLSNLGDEYKLKLFFALKKFLKGNKPWEIFKDSSVREEMVRLGDWLAENDKFEDTKWIIDKFINDPDPEEPENFSGDPQFNYHQQIINGEEPVVITTVLGNLAWVIKKLATRKEYISETLNYTKILLSHKNLYVKLQAIAPLIEISSKRQWLDGWGKRPRQGQYKEFHDLTFDLVKLVKKNPKYKAIAKWLCNVFAYYKDLSTEEVEQVLNALKITEESAGLFVYFAIFRQKHYKDQPINYNNQKFEKMLKEMISDKNGYLKLQENIAFYLWKAYEENPNVIYEIKPYIELILEQPYLKQVYEYIIKIVKDCIESEPDLCTQWYKHILFVISEYPPRILPHTEKIVEAIAKFNPNKLTNIVEKLLHLWGKGAFIGDLKRLFESYKFVPSENKRWEIKEKFQELYNSMRKRNPEIEIDWD